MSHDQKGLKRPAEIRPPSGGHRAMAGKPSQGCAGERTASTTGKQSARHGGRAVEGFFLCRRHEMMDVTRNWEYANCHFVGLVYTKSNKH